MYVVHDYMLSNYWFPITAATFVIVYLHHYQFNYTHFNRLLLVPCIVLKLLKRGLAFVLNINFQKTFLISQFVIGAIN